MRVYPSSQRDPDPVCPVIDFRAVKPAETILSAAAVILILSVRLLEEADCKLLVGTKPYGVVLLRQRIRMDTFLHLILLSADLHTHGRA